MFYAPKHFKGCELVPHKIYYRLKSDPKIFNLFDYRILMTIDMLREKYGVIHINNWFWGGSWNERGFRSGCSIVGAEFSQHKYGRAIDMSFNTVSVDQVRNDILANPFAEEFKYITCVEMNTSWLHIDCRNYNKEALGILKIYP